MNARPTDTPRDRGRAAQSDRRRHRRQRRQGARGARAGRARRRRSRRVLRAVHLRLSAGRPGAQAGVAGRLPRRRSRSWRARPPTAARRMLIGTPWVEDGKLYNAYCLLDGGAIAARALQGRPAELRRVRREARVRAGADAGAGEFPRRAARRADLRGHLGRGRGRDAWPRPAPRSCSCRTARPTGATRTTCGSTSRSRASPRAACR